MALHSITQPPIPNTDPHLAALQELAAVGMWEWDVASGVVCWSEQLYHIFGVSPAQFEPGFTPYLERVHPDDRDRVRDSVQQAVRVGGTFSHEERIFHADGSIRVLRTRGNAISSADGQVLKLVGACLDVTDTRHVEEALRASEESYRTLFELASDAMFVHDVETGAIVDANKQACELIGCTYEELRRSGLSLLSVGEAPYDEAHALELIRRAGAGEPQRFEWPIRELSGRQGWVEVKLLRVNIGGKSCALGSVRDITERKATESELRRRRDELEQRVAERTRALAAEIEDRKEAEKALQRSEEHYRLVIENSSDIATILGPDGTNQYQSPSIERALGYTPEELAGTNALERIHPEDRERARQTLGEMAQSPGTTKTVEFRYRHKDGSWRLLEARGRTLLPDSAAGGMIINSRDITDRTDADVALRRSEQRFRSVVENSSDLVSVLDTSGVLQYQSPAIERIFGYTQDELIGVNSLTLVHPDDVAAVAQRLGAVAAQPGKPQSVSFRFRHKLGHWVHVEAVGVTLSPTDVNEGVIVNSRDISERKETELRLQETTRFLENLVASSPGIVFRGSGDSFQPTYISPNAEAVLGYTAEEFLSHANFWLERTHPDDRAEVERSLVSALEAGDHHTTYEYRFLHKDGEYHNLLASVRFQHDPQTGAPEVLGYTFDVSPLKEAEAAMRAAMQDAQAAREVAEEANRAKSEFVSRMSHELRTPMNSILGFAQLLAKKELPADQRKAVDHIVRAGKHLLNLINEVLDIARIEANRQTLSLEPVHAATLLDESLSMIRPTAAQHDCRLDDRIPPEADCYVHADRQKLTQVLLNLLSNAIKFNRPRGNVTLVCQEVEGESGTGRLSIGVRDTGYGIPAARMEALFVPFSRLDADHSGIEGTGLGLALSRRLIEAMGGAIRVDSVENEGSTFWIDLPLATSPLAGVRSYRQGVDRPNADAGTAAPATILYIEDNLANLSLVETILSDRPEIRLLPALQGRIGLDLAREHKPDMILLDLHLPDLPGEEVLRELRADGRTREIPVVVISADATERQITRVKRTGADEYLTKPLDIDRFCSVVDGLLAQRELLS